MIDPLVKVILQWNDKMHKMMEINGWLHSQDLQQINSNFIIIHFFVNLKLTKIPSNLNNFFRGVSNDLTFTAEMKIRSLVIKLKSPILLH